MNKSFFKKHINRVRRIFDTIIVFRILNFVGIEITYNFQTLFSTLLSIL